MKQKVPLTRHFKVMSNKPTRSRHHLLLITVCPYDIGASGVIFVSVPTIFDPDPANVVEPLLNGLINSLKAASSAGVQRFVLNSSSKAVDSTDYGGQARELTVDTFNHAAIDSMRKGQVDASFERIVTVYSAARALHELTFWDWIKKHDPPFVANSVVPDGQFGRVLDRHSIEHGISSNGQLKSALLGDWSSLGLQLGKQGHYYDIGSY